jgi:hypothetical protein
LLHQASFPYRNLPDNAAGRVLHFLDAGFHHQRAGSDDRAGQRDCRGPSADTAQEHCDRGQSDDVQVADGAARIVLGRFHD